LFRAYVDRIKEPWELLDFIPAIIADTAGNSRYREWQKGVYIGKNTVVDNNVVVYGPAVIGENCHIRSSAFIRENVIIGDRCTAGNSTELKNAILFDHVQAPHFNYIGDSILGNYAHLGAGVICSNMRLDKKRVMIKMPGGGKFPTGREKFGALIGDGAEIGCQCLLNPGTVLEKNCAFYPKSIISGYHTTGNLNIR
jgi:NDP-sugar pyrophosphorylase family protein